MWALKVILLLLPALAYCKISIRIDPGMTVDETTVSFVGSDKTVISDKERKTFKVDDANLNKAVKAWIDNTCTSVFVKDPTPFGNLYDNYGWTQVERIVRPTGYKIIGITPKPDMVVTAEYENNHDSIPAQFNTGIEKGVEEDMSWGWSTSGQLEVGTEINYSVGAVGGSTSMSYTAGWGKEGSNSVTRNLGSSSAVQAVVPPGQKVVATLTASSATLEVDIYYEATLSDSHVFCNYEGKYKGHHFWAWPLWTLQSAGNLPTTVKSTEHIKVGFYSESKLKISK